MCACCSRRARKTERHILDLNIRVTQKPGPSGAAPVPGGLSFEPEDRGQGRVLETRLLFSDQVCTYQKTEAAAMPSNDVFGSQLHRIQEACILNAFAHVNSLVPKDQKGIISTIHVINDQLPSPSLLVADCFGQVCGTRTGLANLPPPPQHP